MEKGYWVLDGRTPVRVATLFEWARGFERENRIVKQTVIRVDDDGCATIRVSTVFLGLDHRFRDDGPPLLFESMIFGGKNHGWMDRYSTYDEAEAGHEAACEIACERGHRQ